MGVRWMWRWGRRALKGYHLFLRYPVFGEEVWVHEKWLLNKECNRRQGTSDVDWIGLNRIVSNGISVGK
jgi:hypothetical protein